MNTFLEACQTTESVFSIEMAPRKPFIEPFSKPEKIHLQFWQEEPSHLLSSFTNKSTKRCDFPIDNTFSCLHVYIHVLPPTQQALAKGSPECNN